MEGSAAAAVESEADGYGVTVERQSPSGETLMDEDIGVDTQNERTALLPGKAGDTAHVVERDAAIIESELEGLPWWKRPSVRNTPDLFLPVPENTKLIYTVCHSDILDPSAVIPVYHCIWWHGRSENKPHTEPRLSKLPRRQSCPRPNLHLPSRYLWG